MRVLCKMSVGNCPFCVAAVYRQREKLTDRQIEGQTKHVNFIFMQIRHKSLVLFW